MKNIVLISFSGVKRGNCCGGAMVTSLNQRKKKPPAAGRGFDDRSKESDPYQ